MCSDVYMMCANCTHQSDVCKLYASREASLTHQRILTYVDLNDGVVSDVCNLHTSEILSPWA